MRIREEEASIEQEEEFKNQKRPDPGIRKDGKE